jgi:hypothetical protein
VVEAAAPLAEAFNIPADARAGEPRDPPKGAGWNCFHRCEATGSRGSLHFTEIDWRFTGPGPMIVATTRTTFAVGQPADAIAARPNIPGE